MSESRISPACCLKTVNLKCESFHAANVYRSSLDKTYWMPTPSIAWTLVKKHSGFDAKGGED